MVRHDPLTRALASAAIVVFGGSYAPVARAAPDETMCEDPRVRVQGSVDARWLDPIARACERLAAEPGSDPDARVRIVPSGHDLVVEVTLRDGRRTLRRVTAAERLVPTLEALVLVPALAPDESPAPPAEAPSALPEKIDAEAPPSRGATSSPGPTAAPAPVAFEASGLLGGRVAGPFVSVAPAIGGRLRLGPWLFGIAGRWDVVQRSTRASTSTFEMETVAFGIELGRRVPLGAGALDLGVAPRLVAETQTAESVDGEQSSSATDLRLGALARWAPAPAGFHFVVELDAELSPSRLRRSLRLDPALPALPAWSAGIALGVAWATP